MCAYFHIPTFKDHKPFRGFPVLAASICCAMASSSNMLFRSSEEGGGMG